MTIACLLCQDFNAFCTFHVVFCLLTWNLTALASFLSNELNSFNFFNHSTLLPLVMHYSPANPQHPSWEFPTFLHQGSHLWPYRPCIVFIPSTDQSVLWGTGSLSYQEPDSASVETEGDIRWHLNLWILKIFLMFKSTEEHLYLNRSISMTV